MQIITKAGYKTGFKRYMQQQKDYFMSENYSAVFPPKGSICFSKSWLQREKKDICVHQRFDSETKMSINLFWLDKYTLSLIYKVIFELSGNSD